MAKWYENKLITHFEKDYGPEYWALGGNTRRAIEKRMKKEIEEAAKFGWRVVEIDDDTEAHKKSAGQVAVRALMIGPTNAIFNRKMAHYYVVFERGAGVSAKAEPESNGSDLASRLSRLAQLRSEGLLTEEEFAAAKARTLSDDL